MAAPIARLRIGGHALQYRHLTIADCEALSFMPEQEQISSFIDRSIVNAPANHRDVFLLEERMMIVAHYLASTLDDGPDFSMGEGASFSTFFKGASDNGESVKVRITGSQLEAIERLALATKRGQRLHWTLGMLAAEKGARSDDEIRDEIKRMAEEVPAHEIEKMMADFWQKKSACTYLFDWVITSSGPAAKGGDHGDVIGKFPVAAAIPAFIADAND